MYIFSYLTKICIDNDQTVIIIENMKKVHEISKNWVCELKERKELYELVSKKLEELNFYEDAYKIQVSLLETKGEEGNV